MTANNVTYALLGDAMHYWDFFPTRPGWGLVPLWGFGDVVASAADGVEVGQPGLRVLPVGEPPGRAARAASTPVASATRASIGPKLPSPYNNYVFHGPRREATSPRRQAAPSPP